MLIQFSYVFVSVTWRFSSLKAMPTKNFYSKLGKRFLKSLSKNMYNYHYLRAKGLNLVSLKINIFQEVGELSTLKATL